MNCLKYLYDELFPVKIYKHNLPYKLTINERLYLGLYKNANGDIHKVDLVMSDYISHLSVLKIKSRLNELGLIKLSQKLSPEDAKEFAIAKAHSGLICEWCGRQSYVLHEHHYPIPKCDGGTETVSICPNCHYTYHQVCQEEDEK